jgi:exosortase F-associated protein
MLQKLLNNKKKIFFSFLLIVGFILIRTFESCIFYDPFLRYFKSEYSGLPFPEINGFKLSVNLSFRYALNTAISLVLLWVVFSDKDIIKVASFLYVVFGIVLLISFFLSFYFFGEEHKMLLFYIRRFLIQPLFILLFLPAFYYQKQIK